VNAAEGAPAGDKGPSRSAVRAYVRVYNNSTIRGLAARAARDLTAAGWTVVEVGNYARGTVPTTTAYYQEGTDQRAAAEALGTQFRMRVEPRFPDIANASPGLIVIVTNDYASP
jgi:LytR cell envelope-related transcriptional attenuator